jgi:hypothetical protein
MKAARDVHVRIPCCLIHCFVNGKPLIALHLEVKVREIIGHDVRCSLSAAELLGAPGMEAEGSKSVDGIQLSARAFVAGVHVLPFS